MDGYLLGLVQGLAVATAYFMISRLFHMQTGAIWHLAGIYGESNTREILKGARRREDIFDWIDNVEVAGGDVDHIVVAPSGVFALDSKWHLRSTDDATLSRDTERAVAAARRARLILRSEGIAADVKPVVVVWGNTSSTAIEAGIDREVIILQGRDLKSWLSEPEQYLSRDEGDEILNRLKSFKARVDPSRVQGSHR
ncbi:MAG: NERD domain-containing protein [Nocardioidaceae bacterium]